MLRSHRGPSGGDVHAPGGGRAPPTGSIRSRVGQKIAVRSRVLTRPLTLEWPQAIVDRACAREAQAAALFACTVSPSLKHFRSRLGAAHARRSAVRRPYERAILVLDDNSILDIHVQIFELPFIQSRGVRRWKIHRGKTPGA